MIESLNDVISLISIITLIIVLISLYTKNTSVKKQTTSLERVEDEYVREFEDIEDEEIEDY